MRDLSRWSWDLISSGESLEQRRFSSPVIQEAMVHFLKHHCGDAFNFLRLPTRPHRGVGYASKNSRITLTRYCVFQQNPQWISHAFRPCIKVRRSGTGSDGSGKGKPRTVRSSRFPVSRLCALYETAYRLVSKGGTYQDLLIILQLGC